MAMTNSVMLSGERPQKPERLNRHGRKIAKFCKELILWNPATFVAKALDGDSSPFAVHVDPRLGGCLGQMANYREVVPDKKVQLVLAWVFHVCVIQIQ
jgi:hypothetical protein